MPEVDGFEFVRLKARDVALAPIPLCVMTASGPSVEAPAEVVAVLRKPFQLDELASIVDRYCGA
jgi:CheY-like chemotaxis protein